MIRDNKKTGNNKKDCPNAQIHTYYLHTNNPKIYILPAVLRHHLGGAEITEIIKHRKSQGISPHGISLEIIFALVLILLLVGGFALRNFPFSDGNFSTDQPAVLTATDTVLHQTLAKWMHDTGQAKSQPDYWMANTQTVLLQPPMMYLIQATFGSINTLPFYQLFFVVICILMVLISLQVYVLLSRIFSRPVALLAAAIALFPGINWLYSLPFGGFLDIASYFFLPALWFLVLSNYKKQAALPHILAGALLAAMFLTHVFEAVHVGIAIGLLYGYLLLSKACTLKNAFKTFFLIFGVCLVLCASYLPILFVGYGQGAQRPSTITERLGTPVPPPSFYFPPVLEPYILVMSILGIAFLVLLIITKFRKFRLEQEKIGFLIMFFTLLGILKLWHLGIVLGKVHKSIYLFYFLFAFLPAYGIVSLLSLAKPFLRKIHPIMFPATIIALSLAIAVHGWTITYPELEHYGNHAQAYNPSWDTIIYIRDSIPREEVVYNFFAYEQELQQYAEHVSFNSITANSNHMVPIVAAVQERAIPATVVGRFSL
ncbi:hypothetical protein COY95_02330, partial [Candidatus Woesearchaeota archaeon CG_4_10_14_0_8_um_filter_47_5]